MERLLRQIDSDRGLTSLATVVGYLPEEGDDLMWRVAHDGGDEQDLEEHELTPAIEAYNARDADGLMECDGPFLAWPNERAPDAPPPPVATKSPRRRRNRRRPARPDAAALRGDPRPRRWPRRQPEGGSAWVGADAGDKGDDGEAVPEPEPGARAPEEEGEEEEGRRRRRRPTTTTPRGRRVGKKGKKAAADDEKEAKEAKGKKGGKGAEKSEKGNGKVEKSGPAAIVGWRLRPKRPTTPRRMRCCSSREAAARELQRKMTSRSTRRRTRQRWGRRCSSRSRDDMMC